MDSLIETFHIDFKLLFAQAINFTIVFFVLYFFVIKPLMKIMEDRSGKIAKSLNDAKKIEEKLTKTEEEYKEKIAEVKKEASLILAKADRQAEENKQAMLIKAKEEIGQLINQEKEKMQIEKAQVLKEIKQEIASLVLITVEKVLEKKLDSKDDEDLIKKIILNKKIR
ncbi:MAG: F0F1 ATP synthase subunit B [Patescibacteria group bacterium]|nr:F0F1 ATP synthase subunit B [Patescibacteria group bacterium]